MTEPTMEPQMPPTDEPTPDEATAVADEPMTAPANEPIAATEASADEPEAAIADEATAVTEPMAAVADEPAPSEASTKPAKSGKGAKAAKFVAAPAPTDAPIVSAPKPTLAGPRALRIRYTEEVVPALVKQFEYANPNQVPKLDKIVVNVGLGEALANAKAIDAASGDLTMITGQKPIVMKARRSIAQFRVRTGNPIGLKVTLRGQRMWDFLERLTLLTLPRIRDFRGIPSKSFDGRGNYTLGMREQIAFPEIDYDKVDRLRGLEVSIVTTAKSDEESKRLLELLGMPFAG
jgi:large subunit ribosomal protein L5